MTMRFPSSPFAPRFAPSNWETRPFRADHGLRYAYVAGAMANGIGSVDIVEAMGRAGMLGFFGARRACRAAPLKRRSIVFDATRWATAVMASTSSTVPNEPDLEAAIVDLYLRRGVRLVEASAYLDLTLPVVRYRVSGIHRDANGRIVTPNRDHRQGVARRGGVEVLRCRRRKSTFANSKHQGFITAEQASSASQIPMAQDVTAEADSGGHTDNRPAITLLPTMLALRDALQEQFGIRRLRRRRGGRHRHAASAAAAFAMGAAYVVTGSINQACVESGSSDVVREMLAQAEQADVIMAPAADMFEMGVKVQVLKRGTMFAMRAAKLYELYRSYAEPRCDSGGRARPVGEERLPQLRSKRSGDRRADFFAQRDPAQMPQGRARPEAQDGPGLSLVSGPVVALGQRRRADRRLDYQVWCGPAMGAFNEWTKGSSLEQAKNRKVVTVASELVARSGRDTKVPHLALSGHRVAGRMDKNRPSRRMSGTTGSPRAQRITISDHSVISVTLS